MEIVCKQWTNSFEVNGYHIEDILALIQEAYRERAKEGISFATLNYTMDDFLAERTDNDYWFLAFDERKLLGTARLTIFENKSGEVCNFAVLPNIQGKHIGSKLLHAVNDFSKSTGLHFIISHTAIRASSSVKCHLNNGFKIVEIIVRLHKDYSSYIFKNQFSKEKWVDCAYSKFRYWKSYMKYIICKNSDEQNSFVGNMILRIRHYTK